MAPGIIGSPRRSATSCSCWSSTVPSPYSRASSRFWLQVAAADGGDGQAVAVDALPAADVGQQLVAGAALGIGEVEQDRLAGRQQVAQGDDPPIQVGQREVLGHADRLGHDRCGGCGGHGRSSRRGLLRRQPTCRGLDPVGDPVLRPAQAEQQPPVGNHRGEGDGADGNATIIGSSRMVRSECRPNERRSKAAWSRNLHWGVL